MSREQVEITNNGQRTYTEVLKGKTYSFAPGETIRMTRSEGVQLMSTRPPNGVHIDGMGQLKPESVKALSIRRLEPSEAKVFVSPRNQERYQDEKSMIEQDSKYETPQVEESANGHACPFCEHTFAGPKEMAGHIGREHADDTSRNPKPSTVTI